MKNSLSSTFQEFRPALRFLMIFVGIYIVGNVVYGVYVESYKPLPDPVTHWVTHQSAVLLTAFSEPVVSVVSDKGPYVLMKKDVRTVLSVFEGCNGLNVMIVFVSFVIAFGGKVRQMLVFTAAGCLIVHAANLLRIMLLYETALYRPAFFYYFHKYFFTAVLYVVVFGLWYGWIEWSRRASKKVTHAVEG